MSKIYTKTGDKGKTSLFDGTRVGKDSQRIETYGTIDELNSILGVVISLAKSQKKIRDILETIQRDLFDIGSYLANPSTSLEKTFITYLDDRVFFFEQTIDSLTEQLPLLTNFILPGGGLLGSHLHVARTITRRCERMIVGLSKTEGVDDSVIRYFNRLSDLLFTMSRFANKKEKKKETIWTKFNGK